MGIKKRTGFYLDSALKTKKNAFELLKRENFEAACKNYLIVVREDPSLEPDVLIDFENFLCQKIGHFKARIALADFLYEAGHSNDARAEYQELLEEFKEEPRPFVKLTEIYFKAGELEQIPGLYQLAPAKAKEDIGFLEAVGASFLRRQNLKKAIEIYESLVQRVPRSAKFLKTLAELYLKTGNFEGAARIYHETLEIDKGAIIEIGQKLKNLLEQNPNNFFITKTLADFYLKTLKPELAVEEYQKLIKIKPGAVLEVMAYFKKALEIYPDFPEVIFAFSEIKILNKEYSEAVQVLERLVPTGAKYFPKIINLLLQIMGLMPAQILAHQLLAEVYRLEGRFAEAVAQIEIFLNLSPQDSAKVIGFCLKIIKENPDNIGAQHLLAEAYLGQKNFKKAKEKAQELNQLDRDFVPAWRILGDIARAEGKLEEAFGFYEKAVVLEEENKGFHKKLKETHFQIIEREIAEKFKELEKNPWRVRLHLDLGGDYYKIGNFETSLPHLQKASVDPTCASQAQLYLGLCFFEQGLFEKSFQHFKLSFSGREEKRDYKWLLSKTYAGFCKENQGKISEAAEIYTEVAEVQAGFLNINQRQEMLQKVPVSLLKCLSGFLLDGDFSKGRIGGTYSFVKDSRRDKELKVSFGDTYNNRGFIHFQNGDLNMAEEEFSLAIQLEPELLTAQNNLGLLFLRSGQLDLATELLEKVDFKAPDFYPVKNNLGLLYFVKGDFKRAKNYFHDGVKDENNGISWLNLGDLFYETGKVEEALFSWEKAQAAAALLPLVKRRLFYLKPERPQI